MNLWFKQNSLINIMAILLLTNACTQNVTPVEQIYQAQQVNKEPVQTVTKQVELMPDVILFHCDNSTKVKLERQKNIQQLSKKETVMISFQGISHQLSSVVTKNGKKYTNIRWTWHEMRNGVSFLYNNSKKTLAANCIKQ